MQHRLSLQSPWRLPFIFSLFVLLTFISPVRAATIGKVKGKNVLIMLDGMSAQTGDSLYAVDDNGKPKALIRITKVGKGKAIGKITKGRADSGMEVLTRSEALARKRGGGGSSPSGFSGGGKKSKYAVGLLAGLNMSSMTVALNGGATTASLSGSSTGFNLLGDFNFWKDLGIRATLGFDKLNVEGEVTDNSCTASGNTATNTCTTSINYMAISVLGRYTFWRAGSFNVWAGGGVSMLNPSSSESTAVDTTSIKTTTALIVAGGADIRISNKIYIPIQVAYNKLPSSEDVSANYISLRAGAAYQF